MLVDATSDASTVVYVAKGDGKKGKPLEQWQREDASRLRKLWDDRHGDISQEAFGAQQSIGTQGAVFQYIEGGRPLNILAAAKFASGLGCSIADISPTLAEIVHSQIVPVMGERGALPSTTDRRYEPLTPDDDDLLQTYRKLRELDLGDVLLKQAKVLLEGAMRGRTGAEVVPITRQPRRKKR